MLACLYCENITQLPSILTSVKDMEETSLWVWEIQYGTLKDNYIKKD